MSTHLQIDEQTTVRELVGRFSQTRPVFEKYEIDYCCGGGKSLAEAAADRDANVGELVEHLTDAIESPPSEAAAERDWYAASLSELVVHILETHHGYVKMALPRLRSLIPKVLDAHGLHHREILTQVHANFQTLDNELSSHLMKEEQMLFPYIVSLDRHSREGAPRPQAPFGTVENPVQQMEHEHDTAGTVLRKLRDVTDDYALPDDACPAFQAVYEELQRFEADLHQHIHLENNILFPRAVQLEAS